MTQRTFSMLYLIMACIALYTTVTHDLTNGPLFVIGFVILSKLCSIHADIEEGS